MKNEVKSEQELEEAQVLDSDFMEIFEDLHITKEEVKIDQNVPNSDIMENNFNDKIKIELPPLSDYDDEKDELMFKQQIPEPIKDITSSRAQIITPTQAKVTSEKSSQNKSISPKVKKSKKRKETS